MTTASLWRDPQALVLASGSHARRDMLASAGIPLIVEPAGIDERAVESMLAGTTPGHTAEALALAKARDVAARRPGHIVLGADQTLEVAGTLLHKPSDMATARRQLASLAGERHHLHSAYALVRDRTVLAAGLATATLTMRPLDDQTLDTYLAAAGSDILASVGAYQLEKLGAHLFTGISGDHFTILGLPLLDVLAALRAAGALA